MSSKCLLGSKEQRPSVCWIRGLGLVNLAQDFLRSFIPLQIEPGCRFSSCVNLLTLLLMHELSSRSEISLPGSRFT